ncbi:LysR substrate-binding domain-containing protein [Vibrio lentus]|uniref:LysR family transcriptional regulator n=1 Tax=Vibrio lentus TaxID=136468 RepID=A0AB36XIC6_9VIBR|nr:LysR family transcriptional regulator [Vibrio lentus]MCC4835707.1 LysR family transcriptional regulator [Vibrio lentus]PMI11023.1 LysR family transcriptional regulator [Vibrio lentus]PMK35060.1 LysR family transcriptional regulator [Vibrio lentus]PMK43426.1 LysR family transcriptional regulator [Vibrio lentus]PML32331.1 LysR family transcriptional regulator [Vibrio lentus]
MDLNAVTVFTQVVDCGSFTHAAEALNMTKSTVSRKLAELEQHLGVRLITRSTRSLVLTPEGERFYQSSMQMQEIMNQAELEVSANQDLIRGPLNVVLPVELGHQVLAQYIHSFLKEHPNVTLNLELTNREVDIIAEGIDLYAQIGELADSSLVSRYLTTSKRTLVASPEYLEQFGEIKTPSDLKSPFRLIEVVNKAARLPKWHLQLKGGESVLIDLPYQLRVNTITACLTACVDGLGLAVLPEFICREHFKTGRLVRLLPEYEMPEVSVSLVYADRQLMPKRKKVFIDYLLTAFQSRKHE